MPRPSKFKGTTKTHSPVSKPPKPTTWHVCIRAKAGGQFPGDGVRRTMHRTEDEAEAGGLARAYSYSADPHVHKEAR